MAVRRTIAALSALFTAAGLAVPQVQAQAVPPFFEEMRTLLPPGPVDQPFRLALGDLDGDGDPDLIVAAGGQPGSAAGAVNLLYENAGGGRFVEREGALPSHAEATLAVALADVDGDGDLDVLLGNLALQAGELPMRLLRNDGALRFADASVQLPALSGGVHGLLPGDLDGDGDVDLLAASPSGSRALLGDGAGGFVLGALLPAGASVALGDLDADGDLDVVLAPTPPLGETLVLLNDGSAAFTAQAPLASSAAPGSHHLALGDLDVDGDLDLVLSRSGDSFAGADDLLYLNDGTGSLALGPRPLSAATATGASALGDVEGDGDLDVWIGIARSDDRHREDLLALNDGSGLFSVGASQLAAPNEATWDVLLADVDGDGDIDALTATRSAVRLFLGDGHGRFVEAGASLPLVSPNTRAGAFGDMDGDGDPDLVLASDGGPGRLLLNAGDGSFVDGGMTATFAFRSTCLALADLDGDGDADALLGERGGTVPAPILVAHNDGSGGLTLVQTLSSGGQPNGFALGDVDGDGDLDVLAAIGPTANPFPGKARLLRNDGTGRFVDASSQLPPYLWSRAARLADVEGDGDLDGLVLGSGPTLALFVNGGAGVFTDGSAQIPPLPTGQACMVVDDFDGDSRPDVFIGYSFASDRLLRNDGTGTFVDVSGQLPPSSTGAWTGASVDVDGDGDRDLVLLRFVGPDPRGPFVLLNDGAAHFTPAATAWDLRIDDLVAADVDGDGDEDVLLVRRNLEDRSWTSAVRQLARRGPSNVAKPLELDLRGPAGGSWILWGSLALAPATFPPYGTLHLDRRQAFFRATGILDGRGRAEVIEPVAPSPALLGVTLYWQALVGPPPRLTNLEVASFGTF